MAEVMQVIAVVSGVNSCCIKHTDLILLVICGGVAESQVTTININSAQ